MGRSRPHCLTGPRGTPLQPWRSPLTSEAVAAPPSSRLDPLAGERASLVSLRGGKGFGILLRTRRIGFQELGLGNGETRADQRLSDIAAFHGHRRHRPTIARAVGEPDLGVGFAQNPRGMILSRLATFPARPRPFTELTALERIDTKETEIGCNRVAIERASRCGKPRLIDGSTPDVACGDKE